MYNRHKTASATKEAAVELRVTFERKQKYMTTGVRLLPKQYVRHLLIEVPFTASNVTYAL